MKRRAACLLCCTALLCSACAKAEDESITRQPWPSHAPEATPYVRSVEISSQPPDPDANAEVCSSLEELLASIYVQENNFYIIDWEFEMFKELPQDEPYSFVVHLEPITGLELEAAMTAAQEFTGLGIEAKVKACCTRYEGMDEWAYTCIVRCTPEKLWEISAATENLYHVEQLYITVDKRFDTLVWPEEEHG